MFLCVVNQYQRAKNFKRRMQELEIKNEIPISYQLPAIDEV